MIRLLLTGGLFLWLQQFEVAVIRPSQASPSAGTSFNLFEGGRVKMTNEPVMLLIRQAFRLQNAQIAGAPGWVDSDRYDIEAKTGRPEKIQPAQLGPLMQDLLRERFHLKFHREMRELPVLALVASKGGAKLQPTATPGTPGMNTGGGPAKSKLTATATPMALLANFVGNRLGKIVVDKTGLAESYDFTLEWA